MNEHWIPDNQNVDIIIRLLQNSVSEQMFYQNEIEQISNHEQFLVHLSYILIQLEDKLLKYQCGVLLKNFIKTQWETVTEDIRNYVKSAVLKTIFYPDDVIKKISCGILSEILKYNHISPWNDLVEILSNFILKDDLNDIISAYLAIETISDEHLFLLEESNILIKLVPKIIEFINSNDERLRHISLKCIINLSSGKSRELFNNINSLFESISHLVQYDESNFTRFSLCRCFTNLVEYNVIDLSPFINDIIDFIISMTNSDDERVSLSASEFWISVCEYEIAEEYLYERLPDIVQSLLNNMKLTKELINDKLEETINPYMKEDKWNIDNFNYDILDDPSEWNLRKASAKGLESLSYTFTSKILTILFPNIQELLSSKDWVCQELAIFSIGVISRGSSHYIYEYLPELLEILIINLDHEVRYVRNIACWTISRYSKWFILTMEGQNSFGRVINAILNKLSESDKLVQTYAFYTLTKLIEYAESLILPYTKEILLKCMEVYPNLSEHSSLLCYGTITILAESAGDELQNDEYIELFMQPMIERWNSLSDDDYRLIPLMECFSILSTILGDKFLHFVNNIIPRIFKIMENDTRQFIENRIESLEYHSFDLSLLVSSFNLLSGICEGLKESTHEFLNNFNINFVLCEMLNVKIPSLQRSLFGLIGDLAKYCISIIIPSLEIIIPQLLNHMNTDVYNISIVNNATWAFGEICRVPQYVDPYAKEAQTILLKIMSNSLLHPLLFENSVISFAKLALTCTSTLSKDLDLYFTLFCESILKLDEQNKEICIRGLYALISINSLPAIEKFSSFCEAITSWESYRWDSDSINILKDIKSKLGNDWYKIIESLSFQVKSKIENLFHQ